MSRIVALREAIEQAIREGIPEITHVGWHDGAFDDKDIDELVSAYTPAAYVTVLNVPANEQLTTRELNASVQVYVNLITSDNDYREERASDKAVWGLMEILSGLANLNTFGVPLCAPANGVRFRRLRDPSLRRDGISVGCVEWTQGLKLGTNAVLARDFLPERATTLAQAAVPVSGQVHLTSIDGHESTDATVDLSLPEDEPHHLDNEIF